MQPLPAFSPVTWSSTAPSPSPLLRVQRILRLAYGPGTQAVHDLPDLGIPMGHQIECSVSDTTVPSYLSHQLTISISNFKVCWERRKHSSKL